MEIFKTNNSTENLREIAEKVQSEYFFLVQENAEIEFLPNAAERFLQIAKETKAGLLYADYCQVDTFSKVQNFGKVYVPTIEYQAGSVRNDFDFGDVLCVQTEIFKEILKNVRAGRALPLQYAGLYFLRLKISEKLPIFHIPETLYLTKKCVVSSAESNQFAYVNANNRNVQIEMEHAFTQFLKETGKLINHKNLIEIDYQARNDTTDFEVEASVIIPVKNREKTIGDAIKSVLAQKTNFEFNLLIVDNYSDDKTPEIIKKFAENSPKIIHIIPQNRFLNIGGCWNEAINCQKCGKFAVQLDSDDLYKDENTLQKIVDEFYRQKSAMIIGSYTIVDFDLQPLPAGDIKHLEWTAENGMNNALRINGFGAPRAFYTPIVRKIGFPNVSYGEDYAVALRISREWKIGRIFDSIYLCRRWENNSDANIDIKKLNEFNFYKDKIRTIELAAR
ncbi:MAG: glycosyltransferase family 2 protein [Prevotellaceae bacterium]|jgi:hypothetical protein|nr:glycosyltransferase family 2 protein [Prevotellaceae bacterium]